MEKAYIKLKDGTIFQGMSVGASGTVVTEIVCNNDMGGYLQVITDPSCYKKGVVFTYTQIGNAGVNEEDKQSDLNCDAIIARVITDKYSNFRAQMGLREYMTSKGIIGIEGVDTRALSQHIREHGECTCIITTDKAQLEKDIVEPKHTPPTHEEFSANADEGKHNIAVISVGVNAQTLDGLRNVGCNITVYPHDANIAEVIAKNYDGYVIAGGALSASSYTLTDTVNAIKESGKPLLGINLGQNIIAAAYGINSLKMKAGHRGGNYPAQDLDNHKTYITTQNHGYTLNADGISKIAHVFMVNINDKTIEGVKFSDKVFTVQFTPDSVIDKNNTSYIYSAFAALMQ